jgi:hypothetical protein
VEARCSRCLLADNFRFYFTPFNGFFSPFPYGTGSLSVLWVFSLGGWLPQLPPTLGRGTQVLPGVLWISPTRLSLSLADNSMSFGYPLYSRLGALQPSDETSEFGLFRFRSPLLTESHCFLLLRLLGCFRSPSSPTRAARGCPPACAGVGFPIRRPPDHRLLVTFPTISPTAASFIGP